MEEYRLKVLEKEVPRRAFRLRKWNVTGELKNCVIRRFMIIILQDIYLVYRIGDSKMDRTCSREIINIQNILNTDILKSEVDGRINN